MLLVLLHKSKESIVSRSVDGCRLFGIPRRRHLRRKWGDDHLGMFLSWGVHFFDNMGFVSELLLLTQVMEAM